MDRRAFVTGHIGCLVWAATPWIVLVTIDVSNVVTDDETAATSCNSWGLVARANGAATRSQHEPDRTEGRNRHRGSALPDKAKSNGRR